MHALRASCPPNPAPMIHPAILISRVSDMLWHSLYAQYVRVSKNMSANLLAHYVSLGAYIYAFIENVSCVYSFVSPR